MSNTLEDRVAHLERELAELKRVLTNGSQASSEPAWLKTVGMFSGDEVMKRIDQHALEYREQNRQAAKRRKSRKSRA